MWRLLLLLACITTAISAFKPLPPCPQSPPGASSLALPDCMMTGEPLSRDGALSLVVGSRSRENDPATALISWMPDGAVVRPGSQGTEANHSGLSPSPYAEIVLALAPLVLHTKDFLLPFFL